MSTVSKKAMTAAQVGEIIGTTRDGAYQILMKMAESRQVSKISRSGQVFWGKFVPPPKVTREPRVHAGTMTDRLSLAYMQTPVRAGSMDAYAIASLGIKA